MSHKMLRPFIVKVSVLGYFPLHIDIYNARNIQYCYHQPPPLSMQYIDIDKILFIYIIYT